MYKPVSCRESNLFLCALVCFTLQLYRMWSGSNSPAVCRAGHLTVTVCDSGLLNSARTRQLFSVF